jgi:hypothetical protein
MARLLFGSKDFSMRLFALRTGLTTGLPFSVGDVLAAERFYNDRSVTDANSTSPKRGLQVYVYF